MLAILAKVTVKAAHMDRFMKYIEADGVGSVGEPGCLRFDLMRDADKPNVFWIYEVYRDRAAYALHQEAPYFKAFFTEAGDTLDGPPEIHTTQIVLPREDKFWRKA
jgi:quinol monooxygenase YgiN